VDGTQEFIQWAVQQGVAVAVLAFVLVRLEAGLKDISTKLQALVDLHIQSRRGE